MLYLDVTISGWFPAGSKQLDFVRASVREESLKVFCKLKVLYATKLEKYCSDAVISE